MTRAPDLVTDYLLAWVVAAVAVGVAAPAVGAVTRYSTPILAVMIGSVSLTLTVADVRAIEARTLLPVLAGHAAMPVLAAGVARALGLDPALTAGFVILGAVTPELVTPVMTELAGGATALATATLVLVGLGSVAFVPAVASVLVPGDVAVEASLIVEQLLVAVVAPMAAAMAARHRWPRRVGRHDAIYPAVSAVMVVLIIGGVTGASADVVRANADLVLLVGVGAAALNGLGYALGWLVAAGAPREDRIAALLSVGMRDFAVAAALIVAAGLPPVASLPAVAFGVVEMTTSAGVARWFSRGA